MTEEKFLEIEKVNEELEKAKEDINTILTNHLVHIQEDIDKLGLNVKNINHSLLKDIGITVGATVSSFILIMLGITTNFYFYSLAGLLLLILSLVHASDR